MQAHNPPGLYLQYRNYHHAVEVPPNARWLIISGLNGYHPDGATLPASFEGQAELIWGYLGQVLASANMTYTDLVSMRFYLAHPEYDAANMRLRQKYLGEHRLALTVVVSGLLVAEWKLEIEATAAAV